jgi:TM2 domain-containing membrane protein YozV
VRIEGCSKQVGNRTKNASKDGAQKILLEAQSCETAKGENRMTDEEKLPGMKRPWLAALLGILIVGVGHMYLGEWAKGIGILLISLILSAISGGILAPVMWIVSCVWAYSDAKKINEAIIVKARHDEAQAYNTEVITA